ncbi:MAG: leucine-rich repeat domain-containing protein [Muribaculaceae bacterium]|nr:leucine-rich repeat domain-containing protein [Muribaculaceae bacterium]
MFSLLLTTNLSARDIAFTHEGQTLNYTVIDEEAKTVATRAGQFSRRGFVPGNQTEGALVIPKSIQEDGISYQVIGIGEMSFQENKNLTSVRLPDSMLEIGEDAFAYCESLSEINFPDGIRNVGAGAFGSTALITISWPESTKEIKRSTFHDCKSLSSISIPHSVMYIDDYAFGRCASLTSIDVSGAIMIGQEAFDDTKTELVEYDTEDPVDVPQSDYRYGSLFPYYVYQNATLRMPEEGLAKAALVWPWCEFVHTESYDRDGVNSVFESTDSNVEVYTLSGVKIASGIESLAPGYYIVRRASESRKILIK